MITSTHDMYVGLLQIVLYYSFVVAPVPDEFLSAGAVSVVDYPKADSNRRRQGRSTRMWKILVGKIRIWRKVEAQEFITSYSFSFVFPQNTDKTNALELRRSSHICWWQLKASLTKQDSLLSGLASEAYHPSSMYVVLYLMSRIYEANEMANKSPT